VLVVAAALLATTVALPMARPAAGASDDPDRWSLGTWIAALTERVSVVVSTADTAAAQDLQPPPRRGRFRMNLFDRGDFVSQQTKYWCVAASAQTMINIMETGRPDRSRAFQRRLHFQARRLDQDDDGYWRRLHGEERWRKGYHGLGLTDWAELLNVRGYGPYRIARADTRQEAMRKAARAIRLTGKPAGLVVWRGAHAWVMSGFKATADPAYTDDFRVQKVFIQDPWYPAVSTIWGASRPPNAAVPVAALAEDFLRYDRPGRRHPWRDGRFVLILPTVDPGPAQG
jgi:hypothetical protein